RWVLRRKHDGRYLAAVMTHGVHSLVPRLPREPGVEEALALLDAAAARPFGAALEEQWLPLAGLQQRLQQEQDPQAQRVLAWLQAHPDTPTPLPVSVWIAADGRISKLEFDSLGDAQVDADLRATLQAAPLQAAPPADMRQPMRLGLVLEPK
ncbi:hypothetical protein, partial [Escherichia coli]|uniref:hypothetical protein n=1 Tax=Escherichia coli TaxID=562 RepID=UPI0019674164